jgi:hypothetical protein
VDERACSLREEVVRDRRFERWQRFALKIEPRRRRPDDRVEDDLCVVNLCVEHRAIDDPTVETVALERDLSSTCSM